MYKLLCCYVKIPRPRYFTFFATINNNYCTVCSLEFFWFTHIHIEKYKKTRTCSLLYNILCAGCGGGKAHKNCPLYANGSLISEGCAVAAVATGVLPFVGCNTTVVVASATGWTELECSSRLRSLLQTKSHPQFPNAHRKYDFLESETNLRTSLMAIMVPFEPTILDSVGSFVNPKIAIVRLFCLQNQLVVEEHKCIGTFFCTFNKKCITGR